jgi:transposase
MISTPKAFPTEFRRDVIAVARNGEESLSQIGKNFGSASPARAAG